MPADLTTAVPELRCRVFSAPTVGGRYYVCDVLRDGELIGSSLRPTWHEAMASAAAILTTTTTTTTTTLTRSLSP